LERLVREGPASPGLDNLFAVVSYEVITKRPPTPRLTIKAKAAGEMCFTASAQWGNGFAVKLRLDVALHKCPLDPLAAIASVELTDYKVVLLDKQKGTAASGAVNYRVESQSAVFGGQPVG